jgi:hypothetical protein
MARSRNLNTTSCRRRLASANARLREEEATRNLELSLFGDDVLADLPPINNPTNFDVAFPPDAATTTTTANNNPPPAVANPAVAPQEEEEPVHIIPLLVVPFHKLVHVNISRLTSTNHSSAPAEFASKNPRPTHCNPTCFQKTHFSVFRLRCTKKSDNQTNHGNDGAEETTQSTFKGKCFVFDKIELQ